MQTIGKLARKHGLSRSTLLYYDSIGLLRPRGRSEAGYRRYSEDDERTLEKICQLRETGLSLIDIKGLLRSKGLDTASALEARLIQINREIQDLRAQQSVIVHLLKKPSLLKRGRTLTKETWVAVLKSAGLDEAGMHRWHQAFENHFPEGHQDFLESLSISSREITRIRKWSKE